MSIRVPSRVFLFVLSSLVGAGCAGQNLREIPADQRAQMIKAELDEGRILMIDGGKLLDGSQGDTRADDALQKFGEAEAHFTYALELADADRGSPPSATPRIALANCLYTSALAWEWKHDRAQDAIRDAKDKGTSLPAGLEADAAHSLERARDFAQRASTLYEFYQQYLYGNYPIPLTFQNMGRNYQILGEWRKAATAYR
ncbi:MAG: hypothetical protein KDC38_17325, partial [Planctomycetes bacterium]|nr:hypothetical protein [Planctomycetota bacterium]